MTDKEKKFSDLGLDFRLLQALEEMGLVNLTPVQDKVIPVGLTGRDVIARARTGSGKTAAYGLVLLNKILRTNEANRKEKIQGVQAVVFVPTLELCEQISEYLKSVAKYCKKEIKIVNGGEGKTLQATRVLMAENPQVVIITPSRALKQIKEGGLRLTDTLETVVIDEADLILSFGYKEDVEALAKHIPRKSQKLLMSATLPKDVEDFSNLILQKPEKCIIGEENSAEKLMQYVVSCKEEDKFFLMYVVLKLKLITGKCIIFVSEIDRSYKLKLFLEQFGIKSCVLNSDLPIKSRYHIVEEFNRGIYEYIIATDEGIKTEENDTENKRNQYGVVRGIDFKDAEAVINLDFPKTPESYTHRIGRTARGNKRGMSLSFVSTIVGAQKQGNSKAQSQAKIQKKLFEGVKADQKSKGCTIEDYEFDMTQISGLKYRCEDALRAVTKTAVREAQIKEIKRQILNSEVLKTHFDDKPMDLNYVKHDRSLYHPAKIQDHLKHIPDYLAPKISGVSGGGGDLVVEEKAAELGLIRFSNPNKNKRAPQKKKRSGDPLRNFGASKRRRK